MRRSDDELLAEPIVVAGVGRSGMNVLGEIIARHGPLATAAEPRLIWKHGNDRKSDMLRPEDARPKVIAYIRSKLAQLVRDQGQERLVDVTPGNSVRLGFVDRVLPGCRFVHLVREGVDNVLSMRRFYAVASRRIRGLPGPSYKTARESYLLRRIREIKLRQLPYAGMEFVRHVAPDFMLPLTGRPTLGVRLPGMLAMRQEMTLLEICFWQWRTANELACQYGRRLPPERYMQCQLEELSLDTLKSILRFCDLDPEAMDAEFFEKRFDTKRIGPAKDDVDPEELRRLEEWVEPTKRWLLQCRTARA
ncbi:MAG: sulfotransferase [Planctomycetota bacterium]|jgi:hypothetical protein